MRGVRVKAASWGFLHHIRFYNKILPNDSNYLHTQQRTQDCLDLTQSSYAVRRLSAKRLGRGGTLGRPTRRSSTGLCGSRFSEHMPPADDHNPRRSRTDAVATSGFNNAETAITSKRVAWTISDSCVQPHAR